MQRRGMLYIGLVLVLSIGFHTEAVFSRIDSAQRANSMDTTELQKGQAVLSRHEATLLSVPGVMGVGVGATEEGEHVAIHVYVNVNATGGTIPPAIPQQLDDVPVRVIETDEFRAQ